ncbi:prostaglandin E2 receptor EP4 subtype-like isoform X2 [Ostrea edulis]|nr:prostaglandin E2 receptor EP4 subtype-like isoform X2 [Ostrea edulis]
MRNMTVYRILCEEKENESAVPVYIQMTFGALGNILALILLWVGRHEHKWRSFYILFMGLVITDLLNNCVCYSLILRRYISNFTWCLPEQLCDLLSFLETFSHLTSGMIIGAMAIDRYAYVTGRRHRTGFESRRMTYLIVLSVILFFALVISGLQLVGLGNSQLYYPGSWCFLDFTDKSLDNKINALIYSFVGIITILVTLIIGIKTTVLTCRNSEYQALLLDNHLVSGVYDNHVIKFLFISIFTFVFLWGPLLIDIFLHVINITTSNNKKELWLIRLMYLNTQINPWLYVILRKESVRRFFLLVLGCRRQFCCTKKEE